MSLNPLKITFHMDGSGVYLNQYEPLHLDALLAWALAPFHCKGDPPGRDDIPFDVPLPLGKWKINGEWGWHASALFPDGDIAESLQYWRKRFRQSKMEICKGNPNLQNGIYREYNVPIPLVLCSRMVGYALGDKKRIKHILKKQVKYLGKKRAYGKGLVNGINVEIIDNDLSIVDSGIAQRYLPLENGDRLTRVRPPYWNNHNKVVCCSVGNEYATR